MQPYDLLVERIAKSSGLEVSEIQLRIEAKKEKLSGLISREGAAQIIAAELGISFDDADSKIGELLPGMKRVHVLGKVINLFPVREYEKNGVLGKVANLIIADETGSTRAVLWDTNHISLIESGTIGKGDVIAIKNASTREREVHLSGFSELQKSSEVIENIKTTEISPSEKALDSAREGELITVRGIVVQIFQPRFYSVCPECNKKVSSEGESYRCLEHGIVLAKDKAILNFVLDDGTETMRVVMFSDQIGLLVSEETLRDSEKALAFREDFLGTEVSLTGNVKRNQLFNNLEIVATNIEKIDVDALVKTLEH